MPKSERLRQLETMSRSASRPTSIVPISLSRPKNSAGRRVAARSASNGDRPARKLFKGFLNLLRTRVEREHRFIHPILEDIRTTRPRDRQRIPVET